ncbi:MAG: RnfH family protein [Burkholderiales bacterium]
MGKLRVEVIAAGLDGHASVALELEEGATVRHALAAAGWAAARDFGIHGRRVAPETRLADGDRVEIYRPLSADPKDARRRRARRRGP